MKEIVKIAFGPSSENCDAEFSFAGESFRLKRLGVDGQPELAVHLVSQYRHQCDVLALSGFPPVLKLPRRTIIHPQVRELHAAAGGVPLVDGALLRRTAVPWALRAQLRQDPHLLAEKTVAFYAGLSQWESLPLFAEHTAEVLFADLYFTLGLPKLLHSGEELATSFKRLAFALEHTRLGQRGPVDFNSRWLRSPLMRAFNRADVYVVNASQLDHLRLQPLQGKTVIIDHLDRGARERLREAGAGQVLSCFPEFAPYPDIGYAALEAVFTALRPHKVLTEDDALEEVRRLGVHPEVTTLSAPAEGSERFAFVIHPLSTKHLFGWAPLRAFGKTPAARLMERGMGHVPGFHYTYITGIRSDHNGKQVEGDLYVLPSTPKQLLRSDPESVYARIHQLCKSAHRRGAKLIGLGAYTKIVGDAGVTIEKRSPIPVTTGNSLSAAATLWAANFGLDKMGLAERGPDGRYRGTAMVVGATGSIGKVCARFLANQWERVIVVAPRPYKVLELADELKALHPGVDVVGTTNPDKYSPECHLIITSTSAQGEKVMDVAAIRPGCVVCDVSRPFDLSLDDVSTRPDVLVIASGEVELPGEVKIGNYIGLEGGAVYACLAETALLAMEGRHESFSLSRDLQYDKVVEIDRLSRKHGIRLSAIMGHTGEISLEEIALCREHALKRLSAPV